MDLGASTGEEKYTFVEKAKIKDIEGKILKCSTRSPSPGPFLKPSGCHVFWFHDTLWHPFTLVDVCLVLSWFQMSLLLATRRIQISLPKYTITFRKGMYIFYIHFI